MTLLDELETRDHRGRTQRMIELGRSARTDPAAAGQLAELATGGWYERMLAMRAGVGSRDVDATLRATADRSASIRAVARHQLIDTGTDDQLAEVLAALPTRTRRRYAARLAQRRRHEPVDRLLEALYGDLQNGAEALRLLPYGSPAAAARHAPGLLPAAGHADWQAMARTHPDLTADAVIGLAAETTEPDQRLVTVAHAVLGALPERRPDRAVALLRAVSATVPLGRLPLATTARFRPAEIADLILAQPDRVPFPATAAHRLDPGRLVRLAERAALPVSTELLRRLPRTTRMALHRAVGGGWRNGEGVLDLSVLIRLDEPTRIAEARRHLDLAVLRTRPAQRLPYAALLPWDEAAARVEPDLRDPDAGRRGPAVAALIGAARFSGRQTEALDLVLDRRHEQDPVRLAALTALAALPPTRWRAEHLPGLGQAIRDALDAADCSEATAMAALRLVVGLVRTHPGRAGEWLATLALERGHLPVGRLPDRLSDADVRRIVPALRPVLAAWATREHDHALLGMAAAFDRRLAVFDELAEQLAELARHAQPEPARYAVELLAEHRPARLRTLVPELLDADPTAMSIGAVARYLHRHRQDLLTPHLGQDVHGGRFATGRTRQIPVFAGGFDRWTATQQRIYADVLAELARDGRRDTPEVLWAIHDLGALPAVEPTALAALAAADHPLPARRDAALRALSRRDDDAGVPVLLDALADDRARVAVYALRRQVLAMPVDRALAVLRGIDSPRLTVAKEVARLLGELPGGAGYPDLLRLAGADPHRDLRVALLRALWGHLDREPTWPVLRAAATDPDPAVAGALAAVPADRISPAARRALVDLLALLLAHPHERVRLEALQRCRSRPVGDPDRVLAGPLLAALDTPLLDQLTAAADAVFATYARRDADQLAATVTAHADNPRAVAAVLDRLASAVQMSPRWYVEVVEAVLVGLAADPMTAAYQAGLAVLALDAGGVETTLTRLADTGLLHADAVAGALRALANGRPVDPTFLPRLAHRLTGSADERLRRIALAALVADARRAGWDVDRHRRLAGFAADPAPLVAAAARFTFPPEP